VNLGSKSSQDGGPGTFRTGIEASAPPALSDSFPRGSGGSYSGFDLWLHRLTVLLFVFVCAVVGVLLVIVPWRPEWTDNRLLLGHAQLRGFIGTGFVRGLTSGLGLLDIWIGFWEAIHYHEGN
jgi:hypothetical protein